MLVLDGHSAKVEKAKAKHAACMCTEMEVEMYRGVPCLT